MRGLPYTSQNNTKGKRAQKRKQPNTHVPRPDPARNHPSRPRPRQTPQTTPKPKPKRKPHPHNTPHTTTPPHQTHKHKNQTKNTKRGQGGIEEMRRKEKRRGEGEKRRRKEKAKNTKRGQGGIEPPTSSTAHAESDVHARSLEIRNASFASEQWVPFLGSQLMISSPARFSPPSVQARERFVQATRRDARPWEETTLPCCGWKI